ncbi:hypothetical protein D187_004240 [Cystobacter fuscus DSM 2262]|uniref:Uncharacterized protein n=1 Tax=Cystobacter fuscus (strain ATCC 25194 / DSM 2262 / NBRC 100088 / M29) TaxID=1242864 RepID=S9QNU1_CYSF2|nr:hypothetical protein [Cystobacter fuscus]EPX58203.1 hypothetical protein D187_004240 [Cystobacter fuscus DSM 2262]
MGVAIVVFTWMVVSGTPVNLNCEEPLVEATTGGNPRWKIHLDGTAEVDPGGEPLIVFDDLGAEPLSVSVEAAGGRQVLCGRPESGKPYGLNLKKDDHSPQTLLTVRFLGEARTSEEKDLLAMQATTLRLAHLPRTVLIEAYALDTKLGLSGLSKKVKEYKNNVQVSPPKDLVREVETALTDAKARESCGSSVQGSPTHAQCQRAQAVNGALSSLMQDLESTPRPTTRLDIERAESRIELALQKLETVLEFKPEEIQSYCEQVAPALLWFDNPAHAVLNVVQVPFGGLGTTVHRIGWGRGKHPIKNQTPGSAVSFIISNVPHGTDISVEARERTGQKKDVAELLSGFAAVVLRALPSATHLIVGHEGTKYLPPAIASTACPKVDPKPPPNFAPLEPRSSRAYVLAEMPEATVDILFCEGKTCPKDTSTVTRAEVKPTVSPSWTLLAEVGLNGAIPTADPGWAMGAPRFESTGGAAGPETLFELRYPLDVRRLVTASLLFGWRFHDDKCFLGFGPTLLVGSGGGALTQLNLRAGNRISKGLYFTYGVGVRFVPVATDFRPGDLLAVTGTGSTAKAPESFRTDHTGMLVVTGGLSFDLAVLGTAADSLVASMGTKN